MTQTGWKHVYHWYHHIPESPMPLHRTMQHALQHCAWQYSNIARLALQHFQGKHHETPMSSTNQLTRSHKIMKKNNAWSMTQSHYFILFRLESTWDMMELPQKQMVPLNQRGSTWWVPHRRRDRRSVADLRPPWTIRGDHISDPKGIHIAQDGFWWFAIMQYASID